MALKLHYRQMGRTNINEGIEDLETAGILRRRHTTKYLGA
jgi:hypothetical protein